MIAWWHCTMQTPMTTWPLPLTSTLSTSTRTPECECALSCISCLSAHRHIAHTHRGSGRESCVCHPSHPHALMKWATIFDFALPFYFTHLLSHSFHFFPHVKLVDNLLRILHKESIGLVWRDLPPHRLWAQRLRLQGDFRRAQHRAPELAAVLLRQSLFCGPRQRWRCTRGYASWSSPSSHHYQREDLSVSLSSSSVSDRTGRPVGDRAGRPAEQSSQEAQIRTLLDKQKERILAECQAEINRHEFQAAYDLCKYYSESPVLSWSFPYQEMPSEIRAVTDANWAGELEGLRSTSGRWIYFGDRLLETYSSTKQIVALSTAESEQISITKGAAHALKVHSAVQPGSWDGRVGWTGNGHEMWCRPRASLVCAIVVAAAAVRRRRGSSSSQAWRAQRGRPENKDGLFEANDLAFERHTPSTANGLVELMDGGGDSLHDCRGSKRLPCTNLEREECVRDERLVLDLCGNGHCDPHGVVGQTVCESHWTDDWSRQKETDENAA